MHRWAYSDDGTRCGYVAFLAFDEVPGGKYYKLHYCDGTTKCPNLAGFVAPCFNRDDLQYVGWFHAPQGMHWVDLTGVAGSACWPAERGRFTPGPVEVWFDSEPPTAAFKFKHVGKGKRRVLFDGSKSKGDIVSYEWDFGDGSAFGSGVNVTHDFPAPGTYSVKLTVTNAEGVGDVVRHDVRVEDRWLVYTPVVKPVTVVVGDTFRVEFTVENAGDTALTDVAPVGAPVLASDDGADATLRSGPEPAGPVDLAPGDRATFVYEYQAKAKGQGVFTLDLEGSDGASGTVTAESTCGSGDDGCGRVRIADRKIVVNSTAVRGLASGATTCDTGQTILRNGKPEPECTLDAAIELANGRSGLDVITFDIPGVSGMPEIKGQDYVIDDPVVIDGTTQPGAGRVALNGLGKEIVALNDLTEQQVRGVHPMGLPRNFVGYCFEVLTDPVVGTTVHLQWAGSGLIVKSGGAGSEIRGLAVYNYIGAGILLASGADGCLIEQNWIGWDGKRGRGNGSLCARYHDHVDNPTLLWDYLGAGILVKSSNNRIRGNLFRGNGSVALPVNIPGDVAAVEGIGLWVHGSENLVVGNVFGGGSGPQGSRQQVDAVMTGAGGNEFGGPGAGEGNDAYGGGQYGITLISDGNLVRGNSIAEPLVVAGDRNVVGGYQRGEENVLDSVDVDGDFNRLIRNWIGVTPDGHLFASDAARERVLVEGRGTVLARNWIANGLVFGVDIHFGASESLLVENTITNNGWHAGGGPAGGVAVLDGVAHQMRRNRIYGNGGPGIDLGGNGPDGPGDVGDEDSGPNNMQNTPILLWALQLEGDTVIYGTLRAWPYASDPYSIEVFESSACPSSESGEAEKFVGFGEARQWGGDAPFKLTLPGTHSGYFTAVATDPWADTSEISACVEPKLATKVSAVVPPGATELQVADVSQFSIGDQITICPTCPNFEFRYRQEETNTVTGLAPQLVAQAAAGAQGGQPGTLLLAHPLAGLHEIGEIVANNSTAQPPTCGDPNGNGVTASDALYALRAAVGLNLCDDCVCDVDGSGWVVATDALFLLRKAVGLPVPLLCPACI